MTNLSTNFKKTYSTLRYQGIKSLKNKISNKINKRRINASWINKFLPDEKYLNQCQLKCKKFNYKPLISIIIPTHNTPTNFLHECIQSVLSQVYQNIELCIADDCSSNESVREIIQEYSKKDSRLKYKFLDTHNHIVGTTNEAIKIANGEFLAFMDHDDTLTKNAIFEVVQTLQDNKEIDIFYSNEDKIDEENNLSEPCFKPEFDLEYFLSFMYIGHLSVYRKSIVEKVGCIKPGTEGSQDYDLALRVLDKTNKVAHIPKILYHWRKHEDSVALRPDAKPYAYQAMQRVLTDGLNRRSKEGKAWLEETNIKGINRPRFEVKNKKNILVILYRDLNLYSREPLNIKSKIHNLTICINEGKNPTLNKADYTSSTNIYSDFIIECIEKFKDVDFIVTIDNDLSVSNLFIDELVEQALRDEIAIVSAKIEDKKGACFYGGYTIHNNKLRNNFFGCKNFEHGLGARLWVQRTISATSLRATLLKKDFIDRIDLSKLKLKNRESFEVAISLEINKLNGKILWTPFIKAICQKNKKISELFNFYEHEKDLEKLESNYKITSFEDKFYPKGLNRKTLDFSIDIS